MRKKVIYPVKRGQKCIKNIQSLTISSQKFVHVSFFLYLCARKLFNLYIFVHMFYNEKSKQIIDGLCFQMRVFFAQYNCSVEYRDTPRKALIMYAASGNLLYGYEFYTDMSGELTSIKCIGKNLEKDVMGMQNSGKIFELPIKRIDTSDFPGSVMVYI